jgi:uncharacterized repeat protein (TIGR02543 family)
VTLTATPSSGYVFSGWTGDCSGTSTCSLTMSANHNVTATFAVQTFTLSVTNAGNGSVSSNPAGISCGSTCSDAFASGTPVTLTATPSAGYVFSGWTGDCSGTSTCSVTMSANRTVSATFAQLFTVTVTNSDITLGTVTSDQSTPINCGTTCAEQSPSGTMVTLTAMPVVGHSFTGWSGGPCAGITNPTCSFTLAADVSTTATFAN